MKYSPLLRVAAPVAGMLFILAGLAAAVEHWAPRMSSPRPIRMSASSDTYEIRTGGAAYPREAFDSEGYRVRLDGKTRRIVSQNWSVDEFLYSVVPAETVVAVSESAYHRPSSNVLPQVDRHRPSIATDVERVLRLSPDLVIVSSTARPDFTDLLRNAGLPVYRMYTNFTRLEQIAEHIRLIGYVTGEDESAERELQLFTESVRRARTRKPQGVAAPRILGYGGRSTYGDETLFNDVVRTLGAVNVGAANGLKGYQPVSSEQIIRWNPEWIVAGADRGQVETVRARLLADPSISLTQAARNGRLIVFEHPTFLAMSPMSRRLLDALGDALYSPRP